MGLALFDKISAQLEYRRLSNQYVKRRPKMSSSPSSDSNASSLSDRTKTISRKISSLKR
ncbi:hypothetical protein TRVA0_039S00892 [Trichomonascus vanleenenianus]|uniref:uncharacterized protein n=1 Tax=Trichomonascus vanleenenianus TaxID=2268995 RepID=UPI003ECA2C66